MQDVLRLILVLAFFGALGLIPATVAKRKGRDPVLWWFYGTFFFLIAVIHAALLQPTEAEEERHREATLHATAAAADAISKFAQLYRDGLISQAEFEAKKRQLLGAEESASQLQ